MKKKRIEEDEALFLIEKRSLKISDLLKEYFDELRKRLMSLKINIFQKNSSQLL